MANPGDKIFILQMAEHVYGYFSTKEAAEKAWQVIRRSEDYGNEIMKKAGLEPSYHASSLWIHEEELR